jgi:hypothetical protein
VEIREATREDLPSLNALYRTVKGRARPESVTRHRLFDTPWGDSITTVAVADGECVSVVVYWPAAFRIADELIVGAQGMEAVTDPAFRGRPRMFINVAITGRDLALERGWHLLYTWPNDRSIKLTKHVGATYLGEVGAWGIDFDRRRLRLPKRLRRRDEPDEPATIDELATLAAQAHAQHDVIRIEKSAAWLTWRYSDATCERYAWLIMRGDSGSLTAAALLGERDPAGWGADFAGIFRVHELFALDEDGATTVLRRAVDYVRRAGARKLDVLVKDPMLERAVQATGFRLEHRHPITSVAQASRTYGVDPYDFGHWRLISGDHDFF